MPVSMQYLREYDPVTLDEAKKLKRLAYSKKCSWYYVDIDGIPLVPRGLYYSEMELNHNEYDDFIYSAPDRKDPDVIKLLNL